MADITERLRDSARIQARELDTPEYRCNPRQTIQWEAADLIESLRATANDALAELAKVEIKALNSATAPSCRKCNGHGQISNATRDSYYDCPACNGKGY